MNSLTTYACKKDTSSLFSNMRTPFQLSKVVNDDVRKVKIKVKVTAVNLKKIHNKNITLINACYPTTGQV